MTLSHHGKTALVTGAATGIGQAYALRLARDGATIAIADLTDATETVEAIAADGGRAVGYECDITRADSVADMAGRLRADLGDPDILVNNAGIYPMTPFLNMSFAEWRNVMSVNLDALYHLNQAFLPAMVERHWGRIVNMTSTTFHAGMGNFTHYVASKGGVIGFTRSLAAEVGPFGVTVNAIAPGLVQTATTMDGTQGDTGMFDAFVAAQAVKRPQQPQDLVGAMAFLTSDEAAFITGQTLIIDGGWVRT